MCELSENALVLFDTTKNLYFDHKNLYFYIFAKISSSITLSYPKGSIL